MIVNHWYIVNGHFQEPKFQEYPTDSIGTDDTGIMMG